MQFFSLAALLGALLLSQTSSVLAWRMRHFWQDADSTASPAAGGVETPTSSWSESGSLDLARRAVPRQPGPGPSPDCQYFIITKYLTSTATKTDYIYVTITKEHTTTSDSTTTTT